jgi:calcium/proton exchanger cax
MPFLTTIIVPLVGNAAEHASALMFAIKNRMEISLGVAMGELGLGVDVPHTHSHTQRQHLHGRWLRTA